MTRKSLEALVQEAPPGPPPPARGKARRTRRAPAAKMGARAAVIAAYDSARLSPREWVPHSVRLPADVADRLIRQVATGLTLEIEPGRPLHLRPAASHYTQAALSAIPFTDVGKAGAIGARWRKAHLRAVPGNGSSPGTQLHRDTHQAMLDLTPWLRTLPDRVRIQDVAAGAVSALLDELAEDAAGE